MGRTVPLAPLIRHLRASDFSDSQAIGTAALMTALPAADGPAPPAAPRGWPGALWHPAPGPTGNRCRLAEDKGRSCRPPDMWSVSLVSLISLVSRPTHQSVSRTKCPMSGVLALSCPLAGLHATVAKPSGFVGKAQPVCGGEGDFVLWPWSPASGGGSQFPRRIRRATHGPA